MIIKITDTVFIKKESSQYVVYKNIEGKKDNLNLAYYVTLPCALKKAFEITKLNSNKVVDIENLDVYLNKKIDDFINKLELIEK